MTFKSFSNPSFGVKMLAFQSYCSEIETLAINASRYGVDQNNIEQINAALNGGPSHALRHVIKLDDRRKAGAFFTGSELANMAIADHIRAISNERSLLDPTCGTGDLLLACSRYLPLQHDLKETLKEWGKRLVGYDICEEFIRVTKARLILSAIKRGIYTGKTYISSLDDFFPLIKVGDGMCQSAAINSADYIVINPPYPIIKIPEGKCSWATGKVTQAALFIESCLLHAKNGTRIIAILPDVLRSGGRYKKWREHILKMAHVDNLKIFGQFDRWTDIDVFILSLTVKANKVNKQEIREWWGIKKESIKHTVGDFFDVHVGSVVPYRDSHLGDWQTYIYPKMIKPWATIKTINKRRRYSGKLLKPPFVVVRRTSRPGDKFRAVGSIINVKENVAVENHFLVVQPKDSKLRTCKQLLKKLSTPQTTEWLNERIRCRHLTVSSLADLPWWDLTE